MGYPSDPSPLAQALAQAAPESDLTRWAEADVDAIVAWFIAMNGNQ